VVFILIQLSAISFELSVGGIYLLIQIFPFKLTADRRELTASS
jgi:hypothetical protein